MTTLPVRSETPELRAELLALVERYVSGEVVPAAYDLDAQVPGRFERCWELACSLGLGRALVEEAEGGVGLAVADLLALVEELAVGDAGLATAVLLHNVALALLPAERLVAVGEHDRWAVLVPPLGPSGWGAWSLDHATEEGTATLTSGPSLGVVAAAGLVVLGAGRDAAVVVASSRDVAVEPDQLQLGLRAAAGGSVRLDRAPVVAARKPPEALFGGASPAAVVRAGMGAVGRGIARRAWRLARGYAHDRWQGGVPIIAHGAVRELLAAMAATLDGTGPRDGAACWGHLATDLDRTAAGSKATFTDLALATATDAVQVFGGAGYMREVGVEKLMRDAMTARLWPEANWRARDTLLCDRDADPHDDARHG